MRRRNGEVKTLSDSLSLRVEEAVAAWEKWLPGWKPPMHRGRIRVCKKCTGSPLSQAAGFDTGVPHQVVHSLISRLHAVIDKEVDRYTKKYLPVLKAELEGAEIWQSGAYDAKSGMPAENAGLHPDLLFEEGDHPVLFTFAELEESVTHQQQVLPMPPLTESEKKQLAQEIQIADNIAFQTGQQVCFELLPLQARLRDNLNIFVEPQVQSLLDELSRNLEFPPI